MINWREVLSNSTDDTINTDLLICADWCEEEGRYMAAEQIRSWAQETIVMIDGEPFIINRIYTSHITIEARSLFNRKNDEHFLFPSTRSDVALVCFGGTFFCSINTGVIIDAIRCYRAMRIHEEQAVRDLQKKIQNNLRILEQHNDSSLAF